jgi:hypothetical protein
VTGYGATHEARALRIRAGVLLSFWQRKLADEEGEDANAAQRRAVCTVQALNAQALLEDPDPEIEVLEAKVGLGEMWARFASAPEAPTEPEDRTAELIRAALPERRPRESPGSADEFLRGAFSAWLKGRREGEEIQLADDTGRLTITVVTPQRYTGQAVYVDEIPAQARRAGARAIKKAFQEVRG